MLSLTMPPKIFAFLLRLNHPALFVCTPFLSSVQQQDLAFLARMHTLFVFSCFFSPIPTHTFSSALPTLSLRSGQIVMYDINGDRISTFSIGRVSITHCVNVRGSNRVIPYAFAMMTMKNYASVWNVRSGLVTHTLTALYTAFKLHSCSAPQMHSLPIGHRSWPTVCSVK